MSGPDTLLEPLNSGYRAYLSRHGLTEAEVPPLEWCLRRRGGPHLATLATLGPNWRGLLRVLAGTGADAVRRETVEAAVRALRAGHGGGPYIDLCKLTKNLHPVMERDHITESRFFYNNPYFSEGMDMVENGYALLVPRNAEMLGRIRRLDSQIPIPYTHADKDPLMRRLPDGGEHEYPLQAVWDCHIDTFNQLGLRVTPMGQSLGALIHHDLVVNLEHLAGDMRQQAAIFRKAGQSKLAGIIERSAKFEKRIDPKHRAFRANRFDDPEWWRKPDS